MSEPNRLLKAALRYARRGWSIIPINARAKKPHVKWAEFQQRRATTDEIRGWWKRYPDASVGVITGSISRLVVVDLDVKKGADPRAFRKAFPTDLVVRTGSGGAHCYYSYPEAADTIPNSVGRDTGIDVRGDGGYVVAPPSRHASGNSYSWVRGRKSLRPSAVPPTMLERLRPETHPSSASSTGGAGGAQGGDERWLSTILRGVEHGGRNDAATRLAGYYYSKRMPQDVVLNLMVDWNLKNEPPLSYQEVQTIVESVYRTDRRKKERHATAQVAAVPKTEDPFELVPLSRYMATYGDAPVSWVIEDWLPDQTIAMAVAPPGTYKTWLELDLAVSVATGKPFLNKYPVLVTGPVIIIQQEDFHGQIAERIGTIVACRFDVVPADSPSPGIFSLTVPPVLPIYLHPHRRLRFSDSVVLEELERKIETIRPALVIVDPLYSTGETEDFMVGTVTDMFVLKNFRDRYGCSFFIAHHTKKRSEDTNREDAWGSQFLNAFIETGWQIRRKNEPNAALIRRHFKVKQDAAEGVLSFDISTEAPYKYQVELRDVTEKDKTETDLLESIEQLQPISAAALARKLGVHRSTIHRRIENLKKANMIKQDAQGRLMLGESLDA